MLSDEAKIKNIAESNLLKSLKDMNSIEADES